MKYFHELFDQCVSNNPDNIFLYTQQENVTFAGLETIVDEVAQEINSFDLPTGSRIMVVGENCKSYIAAILAISRTHNVFCGFNARQTIHELDSYIDRFDPQLIYFVEEDSTSTWQHSTVLSAQPSKVSNFKYLLRDSSKAPMSEDIAAIIFSSGTTGKPKGIMVSHQGILIGASSTVHHRGVTADDKLYACIPMTHSFGLSSILCAALMAGAGIIMRNKFDPADVFDSFEHHGLTNLQGPPTMFAKLLKWLNEQNITEPKCPNLKYLYTGSAPLSLALKKQVESVFKTALNYGYAVSEYATSIAITQIGNPRDDLSAGYNTIGVEIVIGTSAGTVAEPNEIGTIWIKGPARTPGYLDDPESTDSVTNSDGWFNTGDLGYLDNHGALFVVAREKEVIKHSGFSVYPAEIENLLNSLSTVDSSAVIGRQDQIGDEQIIAFVKMSPGATFNEEHLKEYLRKYLAPYKQPTVIKQIAEFPLSVNNKIMKRKIVYDL